ncbi:amino acid adenylation domain-containing protein, partial [Duganella sp. CT11-25]
VPIGVAGELYVGGAGVARGYLNRPELTAERFIEHRVPGAPYRRLYKSGDRARLLPDGRLDYLGRLDAQVKLRGYRIELGEIEARLVACEGVGEAVVVALGEGGDMRLVAYLVPAVGAQLEAAALRAALARQVAEYMIPGAFVMLEALPLTPNGKLDRKALPAPDASALAVREYAPPQGAAEEAIAAIWQELLGVEQVGRHDHFFELGGHSLMVIGMLERLRQRGWHGDVRGVFGAPTLAELAAGLVTAGGAAAFEVPPNSIPAGATVITPEMLPLVALTPAQIEQVAASVPGGAANIQDIYPLAPVQAGILFHHLLGGEGDAYLMRSVISFDTAARMEAFLDALQRVIDRHDILRSAVRWQGLPQPVQVVHRAAPLAIERLDGGADALERLMAQTDPRRTRMDLQHAPLLRAYTAYDDASGKQHLSLLSHHLVSDHVTKDLLIAEIGLLLRDRSDQLPASLPYRNFIAQTLNDDPAVQEAYFRRVLGDVEEPTAPFGLLDVQGSGKDVRIARVTLEKAMSARLREAARRHAMTPAVLFHVAWALVLGRCVGRDDVVFGTVLSGRMRGTAGSGGTLGMFINTLPIRIRLDGASALDAVAATYRDLGELLTHEQAPLALAQRCSGVVAPAPLFTTLLNYRHSPQLAADHVLAEWEGIEAMSSEERTNYPIDVSIDDTGSDFALEACTVRIAPQRIIGYLHTALGQLLDALEAAPDTPLQALHILPPDERDALLDAYPVTPASPDLLAHQLFERQAARQPDAPAVRTRQEVLSYAELNIRANRLAHYLIGLGVGPDSRVGLALERGVASIVGMLAILKAGGAYVPLDPNFPPERLAHMLGDSAPVAVLTRQELASRLAPQDGAVVLVDADAQRIAACAPHNPDPAASGLRAHHLAYVIYTSGSTGLPKGVMVEHGNLCNYSAGAVALFASHAGDTVLHQNTLNFDLSVEEIFPALASGAAVMPTEGLFGANLALDDGMRPSVVHLTSAHWHNLVGHWLAAPHLALQQLHGVRLINVTGDVLSPQKILDWETIRPAGVRLVNTYGPTEATVSCTATYVAADDARSMTSIGTPMLNARIYILDGRQRLLPAGATGEICIGGLGIARGYLNRDDLNASRFVADPFSAGPGARLYRTGDLGRWGDDGAVYFQGRNDFQVKVRGFRIELEEIESALLRCEGVRDAVVVARPEADGGKRLVAYVVATDGAALSAATLRPLLLTRLAEYMVPGAIVVLPAFPLTPNGKLDRKALPAPDDDPHQAAPAEPPQGEMETLLADIWRQLLGVSQVGRHDDFFALGGHSLLAIQLLACVREQVGIELELRTLFQASSLSALAEEVSALQLAALSEEELAELTRDLDALDESELEAILTREQEGFGNE